MGHKPQQSILGTQQGSSFKYNRFDRSVLAQIYNCLASNWKAPVFAMGLACLLDCILKPRSFLLLLIAVVLVICSTLTGTIPINSCLDWQMTRALLLFVCCCMGQAGTPVSSRMCPHGEVSFKASMAMVMCTPQQVHPERIVKQAKTHIGTGTTQNVRARISWSCCGLRKVTGSMPLKILLHCICDNIINIFKQYVTADND